MNRSRSILNRLPTPVRAPFRLAFSMVPFPWNLGLEFARLHRRFWRSQHWSADRLGELQLEELRRIVRVAARSVPAYREKFAQAGLDPDRIRSFDDFRRLPVTTKGEIRQEPERFRSSAVPGAALLQHRTSGSTGSPMVVYSTREAWLAERAMMYRGWRWAGFRSGDRIATCVGEAVEGSDEPTRLYRNRLDLSSGRLDPDGFALFTEALRSFDPQFVRTYPSIARVLGLELRTRGIRLPSLKGIWTQSETLTPAMRSDLETIWKAPVRDYYGLQEKCAAMSECEQGTMHVHAEFGLVELLPGPHPGLSKIVATGFWNRAMPFLRYETGDLAIPRTDPCRCGRALPVIGMIQGRMEDLLITPSGKVIADLDQVIFQVDGIRESQVIQERPDSIRVLVAPSPGFSEAEEATLRNVLQLRVGNDVRITIERVTAVPRTSSGKIRFLVSRLTERAFR
ncbi:MAG: hypothetical protein V1495_00195 [Pseudomonadota bacterium]